MMDNETVDLSLENLFKLAANSLSKWTAVFLAFLFSTGKGFFVVSDHYLFKAKYVMIDNIPTDSPLQIVFF